MILRRIFEEKRGGFFVDIGAHHPYRFSNTYLFYKQGWKGLNIDAMPGSMGVFCKKRPRDINIEIGVGEENCELKYYIFNEPALNGFSKELSNNREKNDDPYRIIQTKIIKVKPLVEILDEYLPQNQIMDFMSIDVEGKDLSVLRSNNWEKYRPQFVLVEILESSLNDLKQNPVKEFMVNQGYEIFAKSMNTVFFRDRK